MAKRLMTVFSAVLFCLFTGLNVSAADRVAELLPEFTLPLPEQAEHRTYLGIEDLEGDSFTVADIKADVVLIELFSMYCPYCQAEAPLINELYEMMQTLPAAGPSVKIIGIGASNSQFEVNNFRDTYKIGFPLFPDQDMSIYKALSGAGTPGFIGVRVKGRGTGTAQIVLRQSGGFHSKEGFLGDLLEYAGY
jgi:peroxiredoxin